MSEQNPSRVQMPQFLKVPIVMIRTEENENLGIKKEYMKAVARISPFHISAYLPNKYEDNGEEKSATTVICMGIYHYVDMSIDEFDELISKVERSLSFS